MLRVKAAQGVRVPVEDNPHRYIEQEEVEVASSIYYLRRIADGDLIVVDESDDLAEEGSTSGKKGVKNGKD